MLSRFFAVASAGLAMLAASPATATIVTVAVTLDINNTHLGRFGYAEAGHAFQPSAPAPFSLGIGDTLDYTIDFLDNQSLTLADPRVIWAYVNTVTGQASTSVQGEGYLQLIDSDGSVIIESNMLSSNEYFDHFGQQFTTAAFVGGLPSNIAFYGVRFVGTVIAYGDPSVTSRLYSRPDLVTVTGFPSGVPEPANRAMLIAGFGLVGAIARRRRSARIAA
jgi:hypothetical protein